MENDNEISEGTCMKEYISLRLKIMYIIPEKFPNLIDKK